MLYALQILFRPSAKFATLTTGIIDEVRLEVTYMRIPTSRQRATQVDMQTAMTPLIDVVFQLLIFFICTSTGHMKELLLPTDFRAVRSAPRRLPKSKSRWEKFRSN